jgi:hypothetical protein
MQPCHSANAALLRHRARTRNRNRNRTRLFLFVTTTSRKQKRQPLSSAPLPAAWCRGRFLRRSPWRPLAIADQSIDPGIQVSNQVDQFPGVIRCGNLTRKLQQNAPQTVAKGRSAFAQAGTAAAPTTRRHCAAHLQWIRRIELTGTQRTNATVQLLRFFKQLRTRDIWTFLDLFTDHIHDPFVDHGHAASWTGEVHQSFKGMMAIYRSTSGHFKED